MNDLLDTLIAAEKSVMHAAPPAAKTSTWAALEASLAAGLPPPIDLPPPGASLPIAWIAGLIGGAGGLLTAAYLATRPTIEAPPPPPPPPIVEAIGPPPPPVAPEPPPPPQVEPRRRHPRRGRRASLAVQIAELRQAQVAFSQGAADDALRRIEAHRKKFPGSPLVEERDALEALASCRAGRSAAAALARAFLKRYPRSPQADRVMNQCLPGHEGRR